jgi:hypothetical protein
MDRCLVSIPSASLSGCDDRNLCHTVTKLLRTLIKVREKAATVFLKSSPLPKVHRINQVVPVISRGVPAAAIHV